MNLDTLLPIASQIVGRDLSPELEMFRRSKSAIGMSLNQQGQQFVTMSWRQLPAFLESPEGRAAVAAFVNAWAASLIPKTLAAEPIPEPASIPALEQVPVAPQPAPAPLPQPEAPAPVAPQQPYIPKVNPDHATGGNDNAFL